MEEVECTKTADKQNVPAQKPKKRKLKKKRKSTPPPSLQEHVDMDEQFEQIRERCSLSAMNVKSILKHVLGDERVYSMALKAAAASSTSPGEDIDDNASATSGAPSPSLSVASVSSVALAASSPMASSTATPIPASDCVLEPKVTRSKARGQPLHVLSSNRQLKISVQEEEKRKKEEVPCCLQMERFQTYIPIQAPPSVLTAEFSDDSGEEYRPKVSSVSPRKRQSVSPRKKAVLSASVTDPVASSAATSHDNSDGEGEEEEREEKEIHDSTDSSDSSSSSSSDSDVSSDDDSSVSESDSDSDSSDQSTSSESDWDGIVSQFAGGISVPASSQSPRTHGESSATGDSPVNESNDREQPVSGRDGISVSTCAPSPRCNSPVPPTPTAPIDAAAVTTTVLDDSSCARNNASLLGSDLFTGGSVMDPWSPSMIETEAVARRTRSRLPLTDVGIEQLEAAQLPDERNSPVLSEPKATDDSFDPEDAAFTDWLAALMKGDALPEDEDDDVEYNYIADEQQQKFEEEFRKDKAVKVSAKEFNSLIGDLVESVDPVTGQLCTTAATGPAIEDSEVQKKLSIMLAQEEAVEMAIRDVEALEIDGPTRDVLKEQMEMHVQLLAQTFVLGRCSDQLAGVMQSAADMLNELHSAKSQALQAADGRVAPSHTASGAIPTQTPSLVFAIPTIDEVMDIVMTPPTEDMVTQNSPPRRLFKKANRATMSTAHPHQPPNDAVAKIFLDHPTVFLKRPYLLPACRFTSLSYLDELALLCRRVHFTVAEDNLLALGLQMFGTNYDLVCANYLPMKTPRQVKTHYNSKASFRKNGKPPDNNVLKTFRVTGEVKLDPPFTPQEMSAQPPAWLLKARLRFMQQLIGREEMRGEKEAKKPKGKPRPIFRSAGNCPLLPHRPFTGNDKRARKAAHAVNDQILRVLPTGALYNTAVASDRHEITIFGDGPVAQSDAAAVASAGIPAKMNTSVAAKQLVPRHVPIVPTPLPLRKPAASKIHSQQVSRARGADTSKGKRSLYIHQKTNAPPILQGRSVAANVSAAGSSQLNAASNSVPQILPAGGTAVVTTYGKRRRRSQPALPPDRWKRSYTSKKSKEAAKAAAAAETNETIAPASSILALLQSQAMSIVQTLQEQKEGNLVQSNSMPLASSSTTSHMTVLPMATAVSAVSDTQPKRVELTKLPNSPRIVVDSGHTLDQNRTTDRSSQEQVSKESSTSRKTILHRRAKKPVGFLPLLPQDTSKPFRINSSGSSRSSPIVLEEEKTLDTPLDMETAGQGGVDMVSPSAEPVFVDLADYGHLSDSSSSDCSSPGTPLSSRELPDLVKPPSLIAEDSLMTSLAALSDEQTVSDRPTGSGFSIDNILDSSESSFSANVEAVMTRLRRTANDDVLDRMVTGLDAVGDLEQREKAPLAEEVIHRELAVDTACMDLSAPGTPCEAMTDTLVPGVECAQSHDQSVPSDVDKALQVNATVKSFSFSAAEAAGSDASTAHSDSAPAQTVSKVLTDHCPETAAEIAGAAKSPELQVSSACEPSPHCPGGDGPPTMLAVQSGKEDQLLDREVEEITSHPSSLNQAASARKSTLSSLSHASPCRSPGVASPIEVPTTASNSSASPLHALGSIDQEPKDPRPSVDEEGEKDPLSTTPSSRSSSRRGKGSRYRSRTKDRSVAEPTAGSGNMSGSEDLRSSDKPSTESVGSGSKRPGRIEMLSRVDRMIDTFLNKASELLGKTHQDKLEHILELIASAQDLQHPNHLICTSLIKLLQPWPELLDLYIPLCQPQHVIGTPIYSTVFEYHRMDNFLAKLMLESTPTLFKRIINIISGMPPRTTYDQLLLALTPALKNHKTIMADFRNLFATPFSRHMKGEDDDVWDEVFLDDEKENYSALASELKLPGWQARPSLASSMADDGFDCVNLDDVLRCDHRVFRPGRRAYTKCSRCSAPRWVVIDKDKEAVPKKAKVAGRKPVKPAVGNALRVKQKLLLTRSSCACDKTAKEKLPVKDSKTSPGNRRRNVSRTSRSVSNSSPVESSTRGTGRRRLYQTKSTASTSEDVGTPKHHHTPSSRRSTAGSASLPMVDEHPPIGGGASISVSQDPLPSHAAGLDEKVSVEIISTGGDGHLESAAAPQGVHLPSDQNFSVNDADHGSYCTSAISDLEPAVLSADSDFSPKPLPPRRKRTSLCSMSSCSDHTVFSSDRSDDEGALEEEMDVAGNDHSDQFDDVSIAIDDVSMHDISATSSAMASPVLTSAPPSQQSVLSCDDLDGSTLTPRCGKRRRSSPSGTSDTPMHDAKRRFSPCSGASSQASPCADTTLLRTPQRAYRRSQRTMSDASPLATPHSTRNTLSVSAGPLACSTPSSGSNRSITSSPTATPLSRPRTRSCSRRAQLSFVDNPSTCAFESNDGLEPSPASPLLASAVQLDALAVSTPPCSEYPVASHGFLASSPSSLCKPAVKVESYDSTHSPNSICSASAKAKAMNERDVSSSTSSSSTTPMECVLLSSSKQQVLPSSQQTEQPSGGHGTRSSDVPAAKELATHVSKELATHVSKDLATHVSGTEPVASSSPAQQALSDLTNDKGLAADDKGLAADDKGLAADDKGLAADESRPLPIKALELSSQAALTTAANKTAQSPECVSVSGPPHPVVMLSQSGHTVSQREQVTQQTLDVAAKHSNLYPAPAVPAQLRTSPVRLSPATVSLSTTPVSTPCPSPASLPQAAVLVDSCPSTTSTLSPYPDVSAVDGETVSQPASGQPYASGCSPSTTCSSSAHGEVVFASSSIGGTAFTRAVSSTADLSLDSMMVFDNSGVASGEGRCLFDPADLNSDSSTTLHSALPPISSASDQLCGVRPATDVQCQSLVASPVMCDIGQSSPAASNQANEYAASPMASSSPIAGVRVSISSVANEESLPSPVVNTASGFAVLKSESPGGTCAGSTTPSSSILTLHDTSLATSSRGSVSDTLGWTREEDRLILVTCQQDGLAHATMEKIASCLGGRSASDVELRYARLMALFRSHSVNDDSSSGSGEDDD